MAYDDVFRKIGSFGRYQKFMYVLQTLPVVFTAIQTYLSVFILYVPDHRCANPNTNATHPMMEGVNAFNSSMLYSKCESYHNNLTMASLHQLFDPMTESYHPHNDYTNKLMHTRYISLETSADGNSTRHSEECIHWQYDTTDFVSTFVTEGNLVCSKKLHRTHAILAFMAGFTVGSLGIGIFSDSLVEESPRWLFAKGKRKEAEAILRKIARRNNLTFEGPILPDDEEERPRRGTISDMCSHRQLVFKSVIILFNWFVVALVFLGLSWNVNYLEGDVFFNFFLASIAEVVGFLLCIPLLNRIGRKPVYAGSLLTGGIALLLTIIPVLNGSSDIKWVVFLLSFVGKVGSSAAFATIFLYTAEFFPTVIRNTGIGTTNVCARIGGMVAPYIPDLIHLVSGDAGRVLPMIIFGSLAIIAGVLSCLLPETNKRRLPETFEDFNQLNGTSFNVTPPSNGLIQLEEEANTMQPLNGQVLQSEESEMVRPLSGQD